MTHVNIQKELCNHCGACAAVCPDGIFLRENDQTILTDRADCLRCWHCIAVCPTGAVQHNTLAPDAFPGIDPGGLPSQQALLLAFRERRSTRRFAAKPVPREMVETLIDAARWTPSASNHQDIDWIAIDDPLRIKALGDEIARVFDRSAGLLRNPLMRLFGPAVLGRARFEAAMGVRASLESIAAEQAQGHDPIFHHAPVVLIGHSSAGSELGRDDAIYQAYNIMLLAQRMKLGTCQIGYLTAALDVRVMGLHRPLERRLNLPAGRTAQVALVLGFQRYQLRRAVPRRQPALEWNRSV